MQAAEPYICVSSCYYICVRILLYMCAHATTIDVCSCYYICVLIYASCSAPVYVCPHATIYASASSCYYF